MNQSPLTVYAIREPVTMPGTIRRVLWQPWRGARVTVQIRLGTNSGRLLRNVGR